MVLGGMELEYGRRINEELASSIYYTLKSERIAYVSDDIWLGALVSVRMICESDSVCSSCWGFEYGRVVFGR